MLINNEETTLFCIYCQSETPHTVSYVNQTISAISCEACGNQMSIDVDAMQEFHQYIYERFSTKASRMSEEARQDLNTFLKSLPMRIISKPVRFSSEYNQLSKEVKDYLNKLKKDDD